LGGKYCKSEQVEDLIIYVVSGVACVGNKRLGSRKGSWDLGRDWSLEGLKKNYTAILGKGIVL